MLRTRSWLLESARALDRVYFDDALFEGATTREDGSVVRGLRVDWQRRKTKQTRFIFGRCYVEDRLIKLNRVLAYEWVPSYVVLATLYHEMLHMVIGREHDTTFRQAEHRYVHWTSAVVWEAEHLAWLESAEQPTFARESRDEE